MSIVSLTFLIFIFALVILYYALPKRFQWCVLLAASLLFYAAGGVKALGYILVTSVSIYLAAAGIQRGFVRQRAYLREQKQNLSKEEKKAYKQKCQNGRRRILIAALILNFGILCVLKYFHFAFTQVNSLLGLLGLPQRTDTFHFLVPLGVSFYTFQATGYLLDVYWERCEAERNYWKVLLFISFFPQITQGPISSFPQLSQELFSTHSFSYDNYARGIQRMLWGFVKKMLLADILAPYVQDVFANYMQYSGVTTLLGAFMYSVEIYADFSGYMDIMCGICQILGIRLTENFRRPYFSKSVAEYWRRWHISLGNWFKNYLYYPIGISKWNRRLATAAKSTLGKRFGEMVPTSIALILVWLATGLWHGASWAYITWGLVNGMFIILSIWMEPVYEKAKRTLRIRESSRLWVAFQVIRTFCLVTFIKVLPEVGTLSQGLGLIRHIFVSRTLPHSIRILLPFLNFSQTTDIISFGIAALTTGLLLLFSFMQRKRKIRDVFNKIPLVVRLVIYAVIVIIIAAFGIPATWGESGFLYANY